MTTTQIIRLSVVIGSLSAVFQAGCGGSGSDTPTGDVKGSIRIDAKPLTEGTVVFSNPKTGITDAAPVDEAGNFTIEHPLPVGVYQVHFEPPALPQPNDDASVKTARASTTIHEDYQTGDSSCQTAEVKVGANEFVFKLMKKGPRKSNRRNR